MAVLNLREQERESFDLPVFNIVLALKLRRLWKPNRTLRQTSLQYWTENGFDHDL